MEDAINLPKSLARIGEADFDEVFIEELRDQESSVALERFCGEGGWPDPETVDFDMVSVTKTDDGCIVRASCKFTETVSTGCADISRNYPGTLNFDVVLDKKLGVSWIEYNLE